MREISERDLKKEEGRQRDGGDDGRGGKGGEGGVEETETRGSLQH